MHSNSGLEVIKLLSCSTQMTIKFSLLINVLINVKIPTIVDILTFISKVNRQERFICLFTLLINVKTPTIVDILTFISKVNRQMRFKV